MTKKMQKLGLFVRKATAKEVLVERLTRESSIRVGLKAGQPRPEFKLDTGIVFLNHMLEHVVWRSGFNLEVSYENTQFRLEHVICEDVGIVLGRAFKELLQVLMCEKGVEGKGDANSMIDEAAVLSIVSFEGRVGYTMDLEAMPGAQDKLVEDMKATDLKQFFQGFANGAQASLYFKGFSGDDPHHVWEAIFRAFGEALGKVFIINPRRKDSTAGVKGTLA